MKILIIFSIDARLVISDFHVSWITEKTMEMRFEDNSTAEIRLKATSNIPGLETPCLFSGKFVKDPRSTIAVFGCKSSNLTSLSINSKFVTDGLIDLTLIKEMTYEFIPDLEPTLNELENDVVAPTRRKRQVLRNEGEDTFIPPENPRKPRRKYRKQLPGKVSLKTKVMYDTSLLKHFGNSDTRTKEWISAVVELAKPRMAHSSLTLPIEISVENVGFLNREIKADSPSIYSLRPTSLTSYFCADFGGGVIGVAWLGVACRTDRYAVNINELYTEINSELATARIYAHELGHNLGME